MRPTSAPYRALRLFAQLRLDGVFDVVRELLAAAGEELDAVVRRRVVGGGQHDAEIGVEIGHQVGGRRGGKNTGVIDVDSGAGKPGFDGGGEELATGSGVPGDDGAGPLAVGCAVMAEYDGGGLGELHSQLGGEQSVRETAHAICSK